MSIVIQAQENRTSIHEKYLSQRTIFQAELPPLHRVWVYKQRNQNGDCAAMRENQNLIIPRVALTYFLQKWIDSGDNIG